MSEMTPEPTSQDLQLAPPPAPSAGSPHPSPNYARRLTAAIVAAVILATGGGIGAGWAMARLISSHNTTQAHVQTVQPIRQSTSSGSTKLDISAITRRVSPAIVDINTVIQTASGSAAATGLIITSSGDVLTNNHVVEGSVSIKVSIQGKSGTYTATVIGVDPADDVAVIHVNGVSGLPTVTIADSSTVTVGDTVYALGNALGLGGSPRVTKGIVTALDQTITASDNGAQAEQLTGMIQSDAEISPGDSGGALVNSAGQVIGIITAGQAQGFRSNSTTIAFAIPSSEAVDIANRILAGKAGNGIYIGPVGYLGGSGHTLEATSAAQLGLSITSGAYVRAVVAGSPAEHAGITAGSVITRVNSTVVDSATALGNALHQYKPGDQVKITWISGNATHTANVTLASGPAI